MHNGRKSWVENIFFFKLYNIYILKQVMFTANITGVSQWEMCSQKDLVMEVE